jgi:hypothetical protein
MFCRVFKSIYRIIAFWKNVFNSCQMHQAKTFIKEVFQFSQCIYFYLTCFSFSGSKTMLSAIYYWQQKTSCCILVKQMLLLTTLQFQVQFSLWNSLLFYLIMTLTTVSERDFAKLTATCFTFFYLQKSQLGAMILKKKNHFICKQLIWISIQEQRNYKVF